MAQQYTTTAGVLIKPGAYPEVKVKNSASGLATTGVIALVGEADAGPDYSLETTLGDNSFGPDELADVLAKYVSGPLVDAYRAACVPANDSRINGSPSRFIFVKTNPSTKASAALDAVGVGDYSTLYDKSYGRFGSLIYFTVAAKTAEVKPTTGSFTYIPPVGTVNMAFRANGDVAQTVSSLANAQPNTFSAAVDALNDISATGGANRGTIVFNVLNTLATTFNGGYSLTVTRSTAWDVTPTPGDTMIIPSGSQIAGGGSANVGAYVVISATSTTITATKLSDAGKGGAVIGTVTAPVTVGATPEAASTDVSCWSPITITLTDTDVEDGIGKTLEIADLGPGSGASDLLSRTAFVLGSTTPVTWASTSASPKLITSAAEYAVTLSLDRQLDGASEEFSAGGAIALKLGYYGTGATCQVTVTSTTISSVVTGGSGDDFSLLLKDFPTINDLAAYLNSQPGYMCAAGSAAMGSYPTTGLDRGVWFAGSTHQNYTLRLKADANKFYTAISASNLVQQGNPAARVDRGLPAVMSTPTYLSGGAKGATTDAIAIAALDALEAVDCNFVVPLFSRDAADDITDELTDSGSTYTADTIHAYCRTHVLKMSTLKRKRNRQGFVGKRGSFTECKEAAANLATYRMAMTFQDVKVVGSAGTYQAQPHVLAAIAAGMQAAGFYRSLTFKGINCSGVLMADGSYKETLDSDVEDALLAGLLPAQKDDSGVTWVSDQTTYSTDDNEVYNSIQAVYVSDIMALSSAKRLQKAFTGETHADASATLIRSAFEAILNEFLRLKLIAPSDDAPKGYLNVSVKVVGKVALCSAEVKLNGAIYFIPISFLVSQVTQTA